ncbi:CATRA system-associated protein [Streptomyces sp. NPDC086549]|uniref:CATRA system-associated protein n=1 Tax=Streptomyces sp. NPDC086549 TaxID=3365752 RepID=UPI0038277D99
MHSRGGSPETGISQEIRGRARSVLGDLLEWRLPAHVWERPGRVVEDMAASWTAGDEDALDVATARLEVLSPHRVRRMRDTAGVPPCAGLRERVVALVHAMDGDRAGDPRSASAPDADEDGLRR